MLSHFRLGCAQEVFLKLQLRLLGDAELASYMGDKQLPGVNEKTFQYVSAAGFLVYATAIFDSFLSDVTKFLLLSKPDALGQSCVVPIGTLASPKSRAAILNKEIGKKVRSLSTHSGIEERIEFVCQKFALTYRPSEDDLRSLRSYWDLRNEIVHDQSIFGFEVDDTQQNRIISKGANLLTPTNISFEDGRKATNVHAVVAYGIYRSVLKDFLKASNEEIRGLSADGEEPFGPPRGLSDESAEIVRRLFDILPRSKNDS
jgi:hypothetical protein